MNNDQSPDVPVSASPFQPVEIVTEHPQQQPNKRTPLVIVGIVIAAILLIGGGVFAYVNFLNPTISPLDILKNSVQASLSVKSFVFSATSTGSIEDKVGGGVPSASNFTLTSKGSVDFHSIATILYDITFGLNASVNTATSTGSLAVGINYLYTDHNMYVNLKNFNVAYQTTDPSASGIQMFIAIANGIATSLENKWIQLNSTTTPVVASTNSTLSSADAQTLRDYITGMKYITQINNLGTENINGVSTYHLKMTIQNGQDLVDIMRKIALEHEASTTSSDTEAFNTQMTNISDFITQPVDIDLWIGRSDSLVYKMASSPITITDKQSGTHSTMSQEIVFGAHNQPISVVAPASALPLQQLLQNLFRGMFGGSTGTSTATTTSSKVVRSSRK